jgi:UDP-2,3-diacylglucosamine hydrolase
MLSVRRGQAALFVSDMHLADAQPRTGRFFLEAFLREAQAVSHVFVLGDAFDAWVGDDQIAALPHEGVEATFIQALAGLAQRGVAVGVMRGNRDFLLQAEARPGWCEASGAQLLPDPCRIELDGTPVLLTHGDALCTGDTEYQAFRAQARTEAWQRAFLARPLAERQATARVMRAQSELAKQTREDAIMDVSPDAVSALMAQWRCRLLVHGHTHRPAHHRLRLNGEAAQRWVLPDWDAERGRGGMLLARDSMISPVGPWPAPVPAAMPADFGGR